VAFSRSPRRGQPCQASVATFRAMPWTDLDQRTALLVVVALTPAVWTRMAPFSAYRPRRQVKFTGETWPEATCGSDNAVVRQVR
jgi:hypothetical protein